MDRSTLGSSPISETAPAGTSARYEDEYEKLVAEIGKLESIDGRASIRWGDVVELAEAILAGKSKDLTVASYLCVGLFENEGYPGLADGLRVCRDLLATHWEGLFPEKKRMRGRQAAIQWISDRVAPVLAGRPDAGESDRDPLAACGTLLEEINGFASSHFDGNEPSLGELVREVQTKLDSIPQPEAPASGEEEAPAETQEEAAPAAPPPPREIDSPESAREALAEMRERTVKAAEVLRAAQAADPLPYRVLRRALWEEIVEPPPNKDGQLEIAGGDAGFVAQAEAWLAHDEYAALLAAAESHLKGDPLWLDLNFFVVRAMEGLGRGYNRARKAVGDEVSALIRRVPGLPDLRFADGTPLAGEGARLWIRHELSPLPTAAGEKQDAVEATLREARGLAARGGFADAASLLQRTIQTLTVRRDRFVCRMNLARLCQESGKLDLALPQLEALDQEAKRLGIEEWEPALVADLARALWKCHQAAGSDKAQEYFERLCRLDVSAVLSPDGSR